MEAYQLNIESKHRQHVGFLSSLNDFSYTNGGEVNPNEVVNNPQISLYCLDDIDKRAIFVELPPNIDLTKAAFVYQTQYEEAQRLIAVPYETFTELANTLPEIHQPIFVHITGRSGSTLLSHVFNESGIAASLAEPDVATQFVNLRTAGTPEAELRSLAQSTVRFLFKSNHANGVQAHAIKFRNQAVQVMDLFQAAFPQGKNLFLYRDTIGFAASFYRIFKKFGEPEYTLFSEWQSRFEAHLAADLSHISQYLDNGREEISSVEQLTLWWVVVMEWYLAQVERGTPVLAVRFADLTRPREEVLERIFTYCDLPLSGMKRGLNAFDRDAQAGTGLARENPKEANKLTLSDEQIQSITAILQRHPILNTSDFIVPRTLEV